MPFKSESYRPLTSIVSYPERGSGGNNRYRGNCSPKLIEDLIAFFKPEEIDRNLLVVNFNKEDKVTKITRLTKADGQDIVPSKAKTEVKGQEQGFFRKYFGGVGQYNPFAGQNRGGL